MIVPDPEMAFYELDTLRVMAGETVPGWVGGAAANVCCAWLKGRGYAEGHYSISQKGRAYLAALQIAQPIGAVGEAEVAGSAPDEPPSVLPSDGVEEPRAWMAVADNGNIRLWVSDEAAKRHAEAQGLTLEPLYAASTLSRLRGERDEAREIVARCNNSIFGSYGYFTQASGKDLPSAIEDLKAYSRLNWQDQVAEASAAMNGWAVRASKAEDLNRKLVEGLRPFADGAARWDEAYQDDVQLWQRGDRIDYITVGDLRKARSLLSSIEGGE